MGHLDFYYQHFVFLDVSGEGACAHHVANKEGFKKELGG